MAVLSITMFVSLILAGLGVGLFAWSARQRTFQHSDRLSILPLEEEIVTAVGRESEERRKATGAARGEE